MVMNLFNVSMNDFFIYNGIVKQTQPAWAL